MTDIGLPTDDPATDDAAGVQFPDQRRTAQQRAYDHLKGSLVAGHVAEGTFLSEKVIADELGISRTPVREALLRLEAENLIQLVPARGAFVPETTERVFREVMDVREVLECAAVTRIGTPVPATLLDRLGQLIGKQADLTDNSRAFIAQDRQFHQTIVDAGGNRTMGALYRSMRDRQMRMGMRAVTGRPDRAIAAINEHKAIYEALRGGDLAAAIQSTKIHLKNTSEVLLNGPDR